MGKNNQQQKEEIINNIFYFNNINNNHNNIILPTLESTKSNPNKAFMSFINIKNNQNLFKNYFLSNENLGKQVNLIKPLSGKTLEVQEENHSETQKVKEDDYDTCNIANSNMDHKSSNKHFNTMYSQFTRYCPEFLGNSRKHESFIHNYLRQDFEKSSNNIVKSNSQSKNTPKVHSFKFDVSNFDPKSTNYNKSRSNNNNLINSLSQDKNYFAGINTDCNSFNNSVYSKYGKFRPCENSNKGLIFSMQSSFKKLTLLSRNVNNSVKNFKSKLNNNNKNSFSKNSSSILSITNFKTTNNTNAHANPNSNTNTNFNNNESTNPWRIDKELPSEPIKLVPRFQGTNNLVIHSIHEFDIDVNKKKTNNINSVPFRKFKVIKSNNNINNNNNYDNIKNLFNKTHKFQKKNDEDSSLNNAKINLKSVEFSSNSSNSTMPKANVLKANNNLNNNNKNASNNKELLNLYNGINNNYISKLKF